MDIKPIVIVLFAVGLLASACSNNSADPVDITNRTDTQQPSTTAADETTTTKKDRPDVTVADSFPDVDSEIIQRYLAYQEAYLVAAGKPEADPDYAPLYEYTIDPQASTERENLGRLKQNGEVVVDPPASETKRSVKFVDGTFTEEKQEGQRVVLLDCNVYGYVLQTTDGEVLNNKTVTFVLAVEMKVADSEWRVAAVEIKEEYEGVNTCEDYEP